MKYRHIINLYYNLKKEKIPMKKFLIFAMAIISCFVISSCEKKHLSSVQYSNLLDKESIEYTKDSLSKADISEADITKFLESVAIYNQTVPTNTLIKSGYKSEPPKYDIEAIQNSWNEKYPDFIGYNCRITSFSLFKGFIEIGNIDKDITPYNLAFDINSIENSPNQIFDDETFISFKNFYAEIPTKNTSNTKEHIDVALKYFNDKQIKFKANKRAALISMFFHSNIDENENTLFIGHTGLLVTQDDNSLLFIEKLSFEDPYQVIKFPDRTKLNEYLMKKYDVSFDENTAKPFIMENDKIMEGYAPIDSE